MINFDNQKNVKLVVENSKGDIVFAKYLEHVKNTSIKIELGDANTGKYKTILFEDNIIIFEDIIFKI